jgi:HlyD family secretion protein
MLSIGLLAIAGIGVAIWQFWPQGRDGILLLSGRLEGYPTDVDARVPGRIESVAVREGDRVGIGDVIVELDDEEVQARLDGATARLAAARQQQQQAQLRLGVVESQIQEARLNLQQSQGDTVGRITQAEADLATAEAQLSEAEAQENQARAELNLARVDRDRYEQLAAEGAVPQQRFDQAQTSFETAQATLASRRASVEAAQRQVNAAEGELVQARTTGFNPDIRTAQLEALQRELAIARAELDAAQAEVADAAAARQEVVAQMDYLSVISPIEGIVITRSVEPGVVVTNGTNLLTVLDPDSVYLRGYIPGGDIGRVRVGQVARIYLDSAPDEPLDAWVASIDTEASFTPENIYFREDRVRQVFGVRIRLDNPDGFAKPGMPADAEILVE